MNNHNTTIKKLDEISEAAKFERLATDVLRLNDYKNLSHPGVNAEGKTVKGPFDGIGGFIVDGEDHLIVVAHSTSKKSDIATKWLSDPLKVKPNKSGKPTTVKDGDLVKAVKNIKAYRELKQVKKVTVVLTTNREPDSATIIAARSLANENNIDLDIWSVSRIAQVLDSPNGQWIRKKYLGDNEQYISYDFLKRATNLSLDSYTNLCPQELLVERSQFTSSNFEHILLIGPSGVGKSTIALQILQKHFNDGGVGLVIPHETISIATTVNEAIDIELRKIEPFLHPNSGDYALSISSQSKPFIVLVEDVNASNDPFGLIDKVIAWTKPTTDKKQVATWQLICPIWPRYVDSISQKYNRAVDSMLQIVDVYTTEQAEKAIRIRSESVGCSLSPENTAFIAKALGNDPLLIALCDFSEHIDSAKVIETYIEKEFHSLASRSSDFTFTDIDEAVFRFVAEMLRNGNLSPEFSEVKKWFIKDVGCIKILTHVLKSGNVLRLSKKINSESIIPRHDRVLLCLMSRVIQRDLSKGSVDESYISDPYFAEATGIALANSDLPEKLISSLKQINPFALFYAFKYVSKTNELAVSWLTKEIKTWLSDNGAPAMHPIVKYRSLRWRALQVLSEIDSSLVLEFTELFPKEDRFHYWLQARFRNGDLGCGLALVTMHELGVTIKGRKEFLIHVFKRYGTHRIVEGLLKFLQNPDTAIKVVNGCLQMAGYLGDRSLAAAIHQKWLESEPQKRDLKLYLWASARCFDPDGPNTLELVCDAWAKLPEKDDDNWLSKFNLASENVSWELREYLPTRAIPYLVQRSLKSDLEWPIMYMLRDFDHPIVVERMANYLASRMKKSKSTIFHIEQALLSGWDRGQREGGVTMSVESKSRLLDIVLDSANEYALRESAFLVWEKTIYAEDLVFLKTVRQTDKLYKSAIRARARRRDHSVIPDIIKLIEKKDAFYWFHYGRYVWSQEMTDCLENHIKREAEMLKNGSSPTSNLVHQLSERLMEIDTKQAERILIENWDGLRFSTMFIHCAIYVASPKLMELVRKEVLVTSDKKEMFQHLTMHMGFRVQGRSGVTRLEQVKAICEFLDYLSEHDIAHLIEICEEHSWNDIKNNKLIPKLAGSKLYGGQPYKTIDFITLDEALGGSKKAHTFMWIEHNLRRGNTLLEIINGLSEWLIKNPTIQALNLFVDIISERANRADVDRLKEIVQDWDGVEDIISDFEFRVKHRTIC